MRSKFLAFAAAALTAFSASAALAHHSNAMYDRDKISEVKGTVKEFQWTNPHTFIEVLVPGQAEPFSIEGAAPGVLRAKGWKFNSLKAGDQIAVKFHPLKNGSRGGGLIQVTKASGEVLTYEPPPAINGPAR